MVRISGDASVAGELRKTKDGRVECHFPDRMVMIANHQACMPFMVLNSANVCSYIPTGCTFGGSHTQTNLECTATSILSSRSP